MQQLPEGPNPFLAVSRFIGDQYKQNARQMRDVHQQNNIVQALAMHTAQFESMKQQTSHEARLSERAEKGKSKRATEFVGTIHGNAQPGTLVSVKHGGISANYTVKMPSAPATPKAGRVPVKKVRGGKKIS
jgi:hypothetical protein